MIGSQILVNTTCCCKLNKDAATVHDRVPAAAGRPSLLALLIYRRPRAGQPFRLVKLIKKQEAKLKHENPCKTWLHALCTA